VFNSVALIDETQVEVILKVVTDPLCLSLKLFYDILLSRLDIDLLLRRALARASPTLSWGQE